MPKSLAWFLDNPQDFIAEFEEQCKDIALNTPTFSQLLRNLLRQRNINQHRFSKHTKLDKNQYYRLVRGETETPSLENVLNISLGLELPAEIRERLMSLAGRVWQPTRRHTAYRYILDLGVRSITDFNSIYKALCREQKSPLADDE